jgi:hypothetical protein
VSVLANFLVVLVCLSALWFVVFALSVSASEGEWAESARLASTLAAVVAGVTAVVFGAGVVVQWIVGSGL